MYMTLNVYGFKCIHLKNFKDKCIHLYLSVAILNVCRFKCMFAGDRRTYRYSYSTASRAPASVLFKSSVRMIRHKSLILKI